MNITALEQLAEAGFAVNLDCNPHRLEHASVDEFMTRHDLWDDAVGEVDPSRDCIYQMHVYTSSVGHYAWTGQDLPAIVRAAFTHFNLPLEPS